MMRTGLPIHHPTLGTVMAPGHATGAAPAEEVAR
jgi:hypothetical protein